MEDKLKELLKDLKNTHVLSIKINKIIVEIKKELEKIDL